LYPIGVIQLVLSTQIKTLNWKPFALSDLNASPPSSIKPDGFDPTFKARRRAALKEGFLGIRPAIIPTATWGLVTGIALVKSGLSEQAAVMMTLMVYAGSAQLTSLPLIASGAPLWLIFAAGFIVNVRFLIFGAALQPYFQSLPWYKRLAYGYFTTDMSFVVFMPRFGKAPVRGTQEQHWFFLSMIIVGWLTWQCSSLLGIFLGAMVPTAWSLDYAAILALLGITIPLANSRPMLVAIIASGCTAWVAQPLPLRLGLLVAVVVGICAGMWAEHRLNKGRI
jgi:predicted branched-subunit amino acid permease